jgi:hypothetical protein
MSGRFTHIAAVLLSGLGTAGSLTAQQVWLGSGRGGEFSVEILRPALKNIAGDQSFTSVAAFMTGRFPLGPRTTLVAELPFAHGSFKYSFFGGGATESGSALGNPYIGVEGGRDGSAAFGEFGVRAPLASENQAAQLVGLAADLERTDAFAPNIVTVSAFANYRVVAPSGFTFRIRGGPLGWIATKDNVLKDNAELWFAYAVQAGYQSRAFTFIGGVGGRAIITEDVDRRFTDQIVLSATYRVGGLRPGLSLRLPIDNNRDQIVGSTIGVSLGVELR